MHVIRHEMPFLDPRLSLLGELPKYLGEPSPLSGADVLVSLLSAARAGLFLESVRAGLPELALTVPAVADRLAARHAGAGAVADEAVASRLERVEPSARLLEALRSFVRRLPCYA